MWAVATIRRLSALPAAAVLLAGVACGPQASPGRPTPTPTARAATAGSGSPTPPACSTRVLARMSEEQRVGQLILLGLAGNALGPAEADAIHAHHVGSVWFTATSTAGAGAIRAVANAVQARASPDSTANVRFLIAANQEGGEIQALQGPGFSPMPSAVDQGRMDAGALEQEAEGWGDQLKAAGVNMDFAPVLDVVPPGTDAQNQPIGALHREYGHDPVTAGSHGSAVLTGLARAGVATTVKHFPGMGRVRGNTDLTADVVDSVTTPDDPFLQSFQQGIDAGPAFAMVALARYTRIDPDHLAVFSPAVMRLLRDRMGFRGVIVSDDLGATTAVAAIPPGARAVDFLSAGGDLVISKTTDSAAQMVAAILARAASDPAFHGRVDDAAARVLQSKQALGLLPCQ
jgi:beta-N-acetylhexosaminidase